MTLLVEGRRLLSALRVPSGVEAEIYVERGRSREVAWAEGAPKDVLSSVSSGMSVRVIEDGRQGTAHANDLSPDRALSLFEQARAVAALLPPDPARRLPSPARAAALRLPHDKSLFRASPATLQKRLAAVEAELLAADRRFAKVLGLSFRESAGAGAVLNTRGVAAAERSTAVSFSLELLGESGGETQAAWDGVEALTWKALDARRPLESTKRRLLRSFGAGPLPSGTYPVLFEPRMGAELIGFAAQALSGEAVQRQRSFFAGRTGRPVASPAVTLVDDGRLPGGLASAAFDDEGVPTGRKVLVGKGVLKGFYYDTVSAARAGKKSTGNAGRDGYKGAPSPAPTNFYLAPGRGAAARLFKETPRAFVVEEVLGLHTADPVTGDFSVGASGYLWEGGREAQAVKGVTLAGSLPELLKNIDAVAADLQWHGAVGSPTFRVSGLSIGGS